MAASTCRMVAHCKVVAWRPGWWRMTLSLYSMTGILHGPRASASSTVKPVSADWWGRKCDEGERQSLDLSITHSNTVDALCVSVHVCVCVYACVCEGHANHLVTGYLSCSTNILPLYRCKRNLQVRARQACSYTWPYIAHCFPTWLSSLVFLSSLVWGLFFSKPYAYCGYLLELLYHFLLPWTHRTRWSPS